MTLNMKRKLNSDGANQPTPEGGTKEKKFKKNLKHKNPKFVKGKPVKKSFISTDSKTFFKGTTDENGKPEWANIKKKHKEVTEKRKLKRNASIHTQFLEAKKLFEVIRTKSGSNADRQKSIQKLATAIKGNLNKMVMRHDMSRIIQWILKLGPPEIREDVVNELSNDLVVLARNKYSNHIVKCIMKSCNSSIRRKLVKNFEGHVVKLLNSKISAPIIEEVYSHYANLSEKMTLKKELFGDLLKSPEQRSLRNALDENPTLKPAILASINTRLTQLLSKKWSYNSNLVMSAVLDFIEVCEEKEKKEMLEILRSDISLLIKTKPGASVGFMLIWNSGAKAKKDIVKELKCDLKNIAMTEAGSMFLLTLIDSVDDTVLMKKALLPTIIECAEKLIQNEHGKRVILYLFAHRDAHFFHPSYLEKLKMADTSVNVKKSQEKRMNELLEFCLNPILVQIRDNPKAWFVNGSVGLVTAAILKQASESDSNLSEVYLSLSKFLINSANVIMKDEKPMEMVEVSGVHQALKLIIKHDKTLHESGKDTFSLVLATSLESATIQHWLTLNRGCFTLLFLLETGIPKVLSLLTEKFKEVDLLETVEGSALKGAQILCQKAQELNCV